MRLKAAFKFSAIICLVLACIRPAMAGAPSPCIKAVTSQNGNFLVITDMQIEPAEGNTGRVRQLSFHALRLMLPERRMTPSESLRAGGT